MSPRLTDTDIIHQTVLLHSQGMSRRAIARALGIGRNRVKHILGRHEHTREQGHTALPEPRRRAARASKLDEYHDRVVALLKRYPEVTAQRVFEELRGWGYRGGYSIVKTRVRSLRPKAPVKISLPAPSYGPGHMAESDWSPYTIDFTHAPKRTIHVFSYVLHFSRRKCFSVHRREDLHALMDGHVEAFERLGGLAAECKYDHQKVVVLGREGGQPIYNPRFIEFATYYRFSPQLCRPRRPNDKPRVERSFWEFEQSFLNGRSFIDERDLEAQLVEWMDTVCDQRRKSSSQPTPLERFAQERAHLIELPARPYDTARVLYRLCDVEGCISWDGNRYEVPYEHVTQILPVRVTASELMIYAADLSCIATHELLPRGAGERSRLPGRRPGSGGARGPDMDQLRDAFAQMGSEAADFLAGLEQAQRTAGYHARKILALRERYSTQDIVRALAHACTYSAFDHGAVERILEARATPRRLDEYIADQTARKLASFMAESRTEPRSLDEYDHLPCAARAPGEPGKEDPCPDNEHPSAAGEAPPTSSRA